MNIVCEFFPVVFQLFWKWTVLSSTIISVAINGYPPITLEISKEESDGRYCWRSRRESSKEKGRKRTGPSFDLLIAINCLYDRHWSVRLVIVQNAQSVLSYLPVIYYFSTLFRIYAWAFFRPLHVYYRNHHPCHHSWSGRWWYWNSRSPGRYTANISNAFIIMSVSVIGISVIPVWNRKDSASLIIVCLYISSNLLFINIFIEYRIAFTTKIYFQQSVTRIIH